MKLLSGNLHARIEETAKAAFLRGEYGPAVFAAFKEVEVAVREASAASVTDLGVDLMNAAFKPHVGPLTDRGLPEPEQLALRALFAGATGTFLLIPRVCRYLGFRQCPIADRRRTKTSLIRGTSGSNMTVEEFERATERDLRQRANQLFQESDGAGKLVRTALLTEARFYLDEIDRRDDRFRSGRDFWMELAIIVLIVIEIVLSIVGLRGARDEFQVLHSLEASASATAANLTALQQTTEQLKSAAQEQVALE